MKSGKKKNLRVGVIDFFSGCGGASLGFAQARIPGVEVRVLAGIDFDKHACATFERVIGAPAFCMDIRDLLRNRAEALKKLASKLQLARFDKLLVIGCAPCQGFAAHRKAVAESDARRSLIGVFSRIAAILAPDAILMENVPDMFARAHWRHFELARDTLANAGYSIRSRIYNFASFGLPQERFRAVVMAMRDEFPMPEPVLQPSEFATVRSAIGSLKALKVGQSDPMDLMHIVSKHRPETVEILRRVPKDGGNRPSGVGPGCLDRARAEHGGYTDVYGRLAWDRPAVTITARCRTPSCGRFAHPEQNRGLSVREAALLQGFPADIQFEGPFDDKYKQIGNAVPPLVARALAEHLLSLLRDGRRTSASSGTDMDITRAIGPGFAITINGIKRRRNDSAVLGTRDA